MVQFNLRRRIQRRISTLRRCIRRLLDRILLSSCLKTRRYRMLPRSKASSPQPPSQVVTVKDDMQAANEYCDDHDYMDCDDLVALKICLLGDRQVGKTSFLVKYVGKEKVEWEGSLCPMKRLKWMDKTLFVRGARISHSIWEVEGDGNFRGDDHIPFACKDSLAILFMFDLTSRVSLNNIIYWYQQARRWNQTAIPILVGTKFDEFIQLPIDIQWTVASQARTYARVLNATLFFSSATYNINVNKIFKFITAKLFDLPWTVERNLTIGEPIIDF